MRIVGIFRHGRGCVNLILGKHQMIQHHFALAQENSYVIFGPCVKRMGRIDACSSNSRAKASKRREGAGVPSLTQNLGD